DGASGTTRWNMAHNSSGTSRSTIPTMNDSLPDYPNEMTSYLVAEAVADNVLGLGQSVIIDAVNAVQGAAGSGERWPADTGCPSRSLKWCAPTRGCTVGGWSAAPGASKASRSRPGKQSGSGRSSSIPGRTIGWCSIRPPTWLRTWRMRSTT
ncbi:hypothetical protein ACFVYT_42310, partial [Streptomyces sp. NPDC058290]